MSVKTHMYLYAFCLEANTKFIKFGVSSNPIDRLKHVQMCSPFLITPLSFSGLLDRVAAYELERLTHIALADFHVRLEWFKCCPKTIAFAKLMKNQSAERLYEIVSGWAAHDDRYSALKAGHMRTIHTIASGKRLLS